MQYNSNLTLKVFETNDNNNDDSLFVTNDLSFSPLFHNDEYFTDTNCIPKKIRLDNPVLLNILCNRSPIKVKNASYPYLMSKVINNSIVMPVYVSHELYTQLETKDSEVFTKGKNLKLRYYFRYDNKENNLDTNLSGVEYQLVDSSYKKKEFDIVERIVNKKEYDDEEYFKKSDEKLLKSVANLNKQTDKETEEMPNNEETKEFMKRLHEKLEDYYIDEDMGKENDYNIGTFDAELQANYLGKVDKGDVVIFNDKLDLYTVKNKEVDNDTGDITLSIAPLGVTDKKGKDTDMCLGIANDLENNIAIWLKSIAHKGNTGTMTQLYTDIMHTIDNYVKGINDDKPKQTKKERQESYHYPDTKAFEYIMDYFKKHDVSIKEMAKEARSDQLKHGVKAPLNAYEKAIIGTLHKRDVDSLILVGLALDSLCTQNLLPEPLQSMMYNDAPAFSPDETICELIGLQYSGIAVTNYGARDVHKNGLAKQIDEDENSCNVFLDDFVSVLIAIAEAKVAHKYSF